MKPVFIDTSAFVALLSSADAQHNRAKRMLRTLARKSRPLVTSTDVFDESVTFVRHRLGHSTAVAFGDRLRRTRWSRMIEIDESLRSVAWDAFVRFKDQRFSFTDCTSFALMWSMELSEAFTFDADFAAAGFTILPGGK